ncbi:MAG: methionine biosynthesis protein MetW [Proteobacteria bacterium]|nr:methionine biosynthesis protein MetW [Pseudomonadota bacterium]
MSSLRADFALIESWIAPGSRVLDLGCGDGTLLSRLKRERGVSGYGVDIADTNVLAALTNGINVIQSDLEAGLNTFTDRSFDTVILSHTLQAMRNTKRIMEEMVRVGLEGVVSFPNFGYVKNRDQVAVGRMPVSEEMPYQWHDTPNVHLCTMADFDQFCSDLGITVIDRRAFTDDREILSGDPNLLGALAVYRFRKR